MTSQFKQWVGGSFVLLVLIGAVTLLLGWRMQNVATTISQKMTRSASAASLYQGLSLSGDQRSQIEQLEHQYQSNLRGWCEKHCAARMKIAEMMQSGKINQQELQKLQEEVAHAQTGANETTMQHVMKIADLLTSEQKVVFLKRFGDSIESTCPLEFLK